MGKHGVNFACVGGQIGLGRCVVAIVACDILKQALEVIHVTINSTLELAVRRVLALDLVKGLLPLQRVETAGEDIALTSPVTLPEFNGSLVVDGAGDVNR